MQPPRFKALIKPVRRVWARVLGLSLALALASSCSGGGGSTVAYNPSPAQPIKHGLLVRIDQLRATHLPAPTPQLAREFAETVHTAFADNAYANDRPRLHKDASDGIGAIDRAFTSATGPDRAYLVAIRAVLLLDLGQAEDSFREFARSMSIAPNQLAAGYLITSHVRAGDLPRAYELCRRMANALRDPDAVYAFVGQCRTYTGAMTFEGSMEWAGPELTTWYINETQRRKQLADAEADRRRQEAAMQEMQRAQMERDRAIAKSMCTQSCSARARNCLNTCRTAACETSCSNEETQCIWQCQR